MPQKWTGKSLGSPFFQGLLRFFVKYGGRSAAYFIAYFVAAFYALLPVVRKSAVHYIVRRFPKSAKAARLLHLYRLNLEFGKILIDRAALGITGSVDIISSQKDKDICAELAAKGKGLIIITAHCGCWQTAMSCFDFIDGDKYVVYRKSEKDVDKHVHELSGKKAPVNFIDPAGYAGGAVEIIAALSKKGIVCMMGDRTFGSAENKVAVDFFGGKIETPYSIYRIAGATGAPVAVIFFPRGGAGKVDSVVAGVFYVEDKGQKAANYLAQAQKFAKALEDFCIKYPYQFFNYFDMWS